MRHRSLVAVDDRAARDLARQSLLLSLALDVFGAVATVPFECFAALEVEAVCRSLGCFGGKVAESAQELVEGRRLVQPARRPTRQPDTCQVVGVISLLGVCGTAQHVTILRCMSSKHRAHRPAADAFSSREFKTPCLSM